MNLSDKICIEHIVTLLLGAILLSGCSGSSNSTPTKQSNADSADNINTQVESVDVEVPAEPEQASTSEATETPVNDDNSQDVSELSVNDDTMQEISDLPANNDATPIVPDPATPMTTRVDFDITVPAYSSNELQVRVEWGDIQEAAGWVADEYWTLSADLPSDTEHELVVTFSDKNGDVNLASYESTFKTGFNSAESYQINAEQFDSDRWDSDGDGVSNLTESIVGGDSVQLELRDTYFTRAIDFRTSTYESQVPAERPHYEYREEVPDTENRPDFIDPEYGLSRTLTIDIDDSGTGTFDDYQYFKGVHGDYNVWKYAAIRTNTVDSVTWKGESSYNSQGELYHYYHSSAEFRSINAQTRRASGTYSFRWNGSNPAYIYVYEYALVGNRIVDSPDCEPTSGTLMREFVSWRYQTGWVWQISSISKGVDDQFWTVVETSSVSSDFPSESEEYPDDPAVASDLHSQIDDTYLTRKLGTTFYCDFPEFD